LLSSLLQVLYKEIEVVEEGVDKAEEVEGLERW